MTKEDKTLAGICGLYCGTCPNYLAEREGDTARIEAIAKSNNMEVSAVGCDGCLSDRVMPFCVECKNGFRTCAKEKGVTWCFECAEFPCRRLEDFKKIHIVDGVPHHATVIEDLKYMKEHGVEAWVKRQEKAGSCPTCGKRLYFFTRECPACHTKVR
jgi:hypothetical protein